MKRIILAFEVLSLLLFMSMITVSAQDDQAKKAEVLLLRLHRRKDFEKEDKKTESCNHDLRCDEEEVNSW